jgi:hypothetical protein
MRRMLEFPSDQRQNVQFSDGTHDYANTREGLAALRLQHCAIVNKTSCVTAWGSIAGYPGDAANSFARPSPAAYPNPIQPGSGIYYGFDQAYAGTSFSAARGYMSVPHCSTFRSSPPGNTQQGIVNNTSATQYYETGGVSPDQKETIYAGIQLITSTGELVAYYESKNGGSTEVYTSEFSPKVFCDTGGPASPAHYILIVAGIVLEPDGVQNAIWDTYAQEYDSNGQPVTVDNNPVITSLVDVVQSPSWQIDCTKCTLNRRFYTMTDNGVNTNMDDDEDQEMYRNVLPDAIPPTDLHDNRFPFGQMVNWRYGTFAYEQPNFPTTQYLGQTQVWYPKFTGDNPNGSGALAHWEIMELPGPPNAGTSGVGIFSGFCQTVGAAPSFLGVPAFCATDVNNSYYQGN